MTTRTAWGFGAATTAADGTVLDTWYPEPALGTPPADAAPPSDLPALAAADHARAVTVAIVRTVIDLDLPPADAPDAYLRLHLLSHRLVAPHGLNLHGIFSAGERRLDRRRAVRSRR